MKKLLLIALLIAGTACSAQINLRFLKSTILSSSFDQLDKHLKIEGFRLDEAGKKNNSSRCIQYYLFKKTIEATIDYTEVISAQTKCTDNDMKAFMLIRFLTRNEELFESIKEECINLEKAESVSEKVEDGEAVQEYKKRNFTYRFTNGRDSNGKGYYIDLIYSSPF